MDLVTRTDYLWAPQSSWESGHDRLIVLVSEVGWVEHCTTQAKYMGLENLDNPLHQTSLCLIVLVLLGCISH